MMTFCIDFYESYLVTDYFITDYTETLLFEHLRICGFAFCGLEHPGYVRVCDLWIIITNLWICDLQPRGSQENFFKVSKSQIRKSWFIPLSQIRKFLRCASIQIANPLIFL
jgi:hypothetical protein